MQFSTTNNLILKLPEESFVRAKVLACKILTKITKRLSKRICIRNAAHAVFVVVFNHCLEEE